ncbi:MAG TPA: UDP-N-acetylmuramyl-tripeptide synthetase [Candidatus Limnocylindria bacterium]|nr:UDP-N-acetylmuramyl-tripeptide synthetase [Candidatus Limnocylindria bacterium]
MAFIKSLIPNWLLKLIRPIYHGCISILAAVYNGNPSEKLIVIGITGTSGKSTTAALLAEILNRSGKKCGYITTVNFFDGDTDYINKHGLSMPGGWLLQKQLALMLKNNCKYAIVECTSEGLAQNRHWGINFDVAVFTNLSRAHLEAHGSYTEYQQAKGELFVALGKHKKKSFFPQKLIGVNFDEQISGYFFSFPSDKRFGISFRNVKVSNADKVFYCQSGEFGPPAKFTILGTPFELNLLGNFNTKNAALATATANMLGVELLDCVKALKNFHSIRGRMESVPNPLGFKIVVDYGCEPESFKNAAEATAQLPHSRIIHVFGSTGGHRDVSKRFEFGKTSAQYVDQIIITNDDVYNSDPNEIANNIEQGIKSFQLRKPSYEIILDRRSAIAKALSTAQKNDIVLITGKGSEQFLVLPGNKRIEWDDVKVVHEELAKISPSSL